jgi:hypothetical protein
MLYLYLARIPSLAAAVPEYVAAHLVLFVLMAATCYLLRAGGRRTETTALVLALAAAYRLALCGTEPSLSDDVYRYVWDGGVQQAGINPYRHAPEHPALFELRGELFERINHREVPTIYPPLSQMLFRALAALGGGVRTFRLGMVALELAAAAVLSVVLARLRRPAGDLVLYAWNPLLVVETASSGHAEPLAALALAVALWLLGGGRRLLAGAALAAAVMAKLYPAFCAPVWLPRLGRRGLAGMAVASVLLAAPYWTGDLAPLVGLGTFAEHWSHNEMAFRVLLAASGHRDGAKLAAAGIFLAVAVALMLRTRAGDLEQLCRFSLWLLFTLLCLAPTVHPWYVGWLAMWLALTPRLGPLIWTAAVPVTYEILLRYETLGLWAESSWVVALQYGAVSAGLASDALLARWGGRSSARLQAPTQASPAPKRA